MLVSVSMTIAPNFARASRVPYMLLGDRPHQLGRSRSDGNSTNTRLLDGA